MLAEALYHRSEGKWCYQFDDETVHVVLRAKNGDLKQATVFGGDVYLDSKTWKDYPMSKRYSSGMFEYWFVEVKPEYKRFKYYFKMEAMDGTFASYSETEYFEGKTKDVWNKISLGDFGFMGQTTFIFPYLNVVDKPGAPEWVNETIWYQIFPERFRNGNKENDPKGTLPWGSKEGKELTNDDYFGGDIKGITLSLDYIKSLGFNGLYLNPIFKANTAHKYDTEDYMQIDPEFGTIEEFKEMVEEAHKRGIKVMLDGVFNHSGSMFAPWQDVVKNGKASKYADWFWVIDWDGLQKDRNWGEMIEDYAYEAFAFAPDMPRLRWENDEVREYLIGVGKYWAELGIDAWRMDVAYEPSHNFWQEFTREIKKIKPDIYMLGEIWTDSQKWLSGNEFHSVMNYINQDSMIKFFAYSQTSVEQFRKTIIEASYNYADNVMYGIFNLLDSHDTPRLTHITKGDKQLAKLLHLFLLLQTGTPSIYYGSEFLLEGGPDPDCRRCMVWDEEKRDDQYLDFIKQAIKLRKENVEWRKGDIDFIELKEDSFLISKKHKNDVSYFVFNRSNESVEFNIPKGTFKDMFNNDKVENKVTVEAKSFVAFK